MDYFGVVKNSFIITRKHKYLWVFGVIIILAFSFARSFSYMPLLTTNIDASENLTVGLVVLILSAFLYLLTLAMRASIILSYSYYEKGGSLNHKNIFELGWRRVWRLFLFNLLVGVCALLPLGLLIIPVITLVMSHTYVLATILAVVFLLFFICLLVLITFISQYGSRMVVIQDYGIVETLRKALHFVRDNLLHVIVIYFCGYGVSIIFSFLFMIALFLVGTLIFALSYALWLILPMIGLVFGSLAGLSLLVVLLVFTGAYLSFYEGIFTIAYLKLR